MQHLKTFMLLLMLLVLPLAQGYAQKAKLANPLPSVTLLSSDNGVNTFSVATESLFVRAKADKANGNNSEQKVIANYYRAKLLQQSDILEVSKADGKQAIVKTTLTQTALAHTLQATAQSLKNELVQAKTNGQNKHQIVKQWALSLEKSK